LPHGDELDPRRGLVSISPDGRNVVYVARRGDATQLYLRPMDQLDALPLRDTEDAFGPFFSPDSEWVGFYADGNLKKVSITGGAPMVLCDVDLVWGASWSGPDDTIFFSQAYSSELYRVSASGGTPELVTTLTLEEEERGHCWLEEVLPGG
jgi:serine/threonine-protein kinase